MATVQELSAPYANLMLSPRRGPNVCRTCFNLIDGFDRCYACAHGGDWIDAVAPISYSVAGEQLHHALATYKRERSRWARALTGQLAAVLWRHLLGHETCLARAVGEAEFPLVATVPSGCRAPDQTHPLQTIVSELVALTRARATPLLRRTDASVIRHAFTPDRFSATRALDGEPVLLIDDMWTTGASAQSAAAALRQAGSGPVATVVIGRYVHRGWHDNDRRLRAMRDGFDWDRCALCDPPPGPSAVDEPATASLIAPPSTAA